MYFKEGNRKGQVTIFIIIAVVIIASVAVFFIVRERLSIVTLPTSLQPVYNSFLSCLEDDALIGVDVLESQGGYVELPEFEPGSAHMPFSSQLNFLGNPIPYWYYVSGNNIQKTQIPTKQDMEEQLGEFIDGKIRDCVLSQYYQEGFIVDMGEPQSQISIGTNQISINLKMDLNINKGTDSAFITNHKINLNKNLGSLYDSALRVYDYEQQNLFLENYGIDVLRSYAPVDGVELSCSAKVWNAENIFSILKQAVEINTLALKSKGNSNDYFVVDVPVSQDVHFLNSRNWATSFEVNPTQGSALVSNPIGNQPGLGILGFCYVHYHFVYDMKYPILVQIMDGDEVFQFPLAVVIQGNKAREPFDTTAGIVQSSGICDYKNTQTQIRLFDSQMNPANGEISYECFGETCLIGETENGVLNEKFPQCINGFISVRAPGFRENKYMYSATISGSADITLERVYMIGVNLKVDGNNYNKRATVSFVSENSSKTIIYPEQKSIELGEGQYEIQVYIFGNSSINVGEGNYEQCVDILSGVRGFFGITQKKCFDVQMPSQIISSVVAGGGKQNYYISESELRNSNTLEINAESLPLPKTIEELQENYILFEDKGLEIIFR